MNVAEMIEWLKTQDQGAIVQVIYHTSGTSYYDQGGNVSVDDFTLEGADGYGSGRYYENTDFRGNPYVKPDAEHHNKRYLLLGSTDN